MGKRLEKTSHPRRYTEASKHMEICSKTYVFKKMQIKITMRYHDIPNKMAKIPDTDTPNTDEYIQQKRYL